MASHTPDPGGALHLPLIGGTSQEDAIIVGDDDVGLHAGDNTAINQADNNGPDDDDDRDKNYQVYTADAPRLAGDDSGRNVIAKMRSLPVTVRFWDPSMVGKPLEGVTEMIPMGVGGTLVEHKVEFWYDAYGPIVSPAAVPPKGLHNMSDFYLGQILEQVVRGNVALHKLRARWPAIFTSTGVVAESRKSFGRPYLIQVDSRWLPGSFYDGSYNLPGSDQVAYPISVRTARTHATKLDTKFSNAKVAVLETSWYLDQVRIPTVIHPFIMDKDYWEKLGHLDATHSHSHRAMKWAVLHALPHFVYGPPSTQLEDDFFSKMTTKMAWSPAELYAFYNCNPCMTGVGCSTDSAKYDLGSVWSAPLPFPDGSLPTQVQLAIRSAPGLHQQTAARGTLGRRRLVTPVAMQGAQQSAPPAQFMSTFAADPGGEYTPVSRSRASTVSSVTKRQSTETPYSTPGPKRHQHSFSDGSIETMRRPIDVDAVTLELPKTSHDFSYLALDKGDTAWANEVKVSELMGHPDLVRTIDARNMMNSNNDGLGAHIISCTNKTDAFLKLFVKDNDIITSAGYACWTTLDLPTLDTISNLMENLRLIEKRSARYLEYARRLRQSWQLRMHLEHFDRLKAKQQVPFTDEYQKPVQDAVSQVAGPGFIMAAKDSNPRPFTLSDYIMAREELAPFRFRPLTAHPGPDTTNADPGGQPGPGANDTEPTGQPQSDANNAGPTGRHESNADDIGFTVSASNVLATPDQTPGAEAVRGQAYQAESAAQLDTSALHSHSASEVAGQIARQVDHVSSEHNPDTIDDRSPD